MHDAAGHHEDEKPMIPDELTPRQQAEDPVANDPDAAGAGSDGAAGESSDDEDREQVDDRP